MKYFILTLILSLQCIWMQPAALWAGPSPSEGDSRPGSAELTPAGRYAGEVLGYLLKIVTGRAGDPAQREAWQTRGLDVPLPDLAEVEAIMTDSARNELALMVLDPDLRFLTRVLFHYDPRLSLHKGGGGVYPASEFVALRLLILGKIQRGERIRLGELMGRRMLDSDGEDAGEEDLRAAGLRPEELGLIQEIVASEPRLHAYLNAPFLVRALWEIGAVERDAFVEESLQKAGYEEVPCPCEKGVGSGGKAPVRIALLPSLITEFETLEETAPRAPFGFRPTEKLLRLEEELVQAIRAGIGDVTFCRVHARPLVVHPGNAEEVTAEICPDADFVIVLTDKNLYLPMHIDPERDVYPAVPRIYLDVLDLEYDQAGDRIEDIRAFVRSRP